MKFYLEQSFEEVKHDPKIVKQLLNEYKVVVLKDYKLEKASVDYFNELADQLGYIYPMDEDLETGIATGKRWIDITYDPKFPNRYRSAPVAQPLHTDASYIDIKENVQFIYCAGAAKYGGATTFIDSRKIVDFLEIAGESQLLKALQETPILFSKDNRKRTSPILRKDGEDWRFNWNYFCGDKNNSEEHKDLFNRFHNFLETRVVKSGLVTEAHLNKYNVVFWHDELVLHGRNSYFATTPGERTLYKGTIVFEEHYDKNKHLDLKKYV